MNDKHASAADWLLLITPAVIWGASFLFIAEALEAIGPNGVTFVRILIGFATLALFPSTRRRVERRDWRAIALLGIVWFAFPLSMFPHAEVRVSSALTGMLNGAVPLFTAIVASVWSRRLPSRGIVAGLAVGLTGVVLIALPTIGQGRSSGVGVLLIFVAVLSYGFALPIAQPLQKKYGALPVIWRAQAVALVLTAPLGIIELPRAHWTPAPLLSLLALGALGTAIAFVMMTTAAGRLGPTRASGAVFLTPGVALLLGVVVRGERVALLSVIGCVVAVAGAWVMRRAQQKPAESGLQWTDSLKGIDWDDLARLYREAPLGEKRPEDLATVFANSRYRVFVRDEGRLVGAGRALADGVDASYICDVAVRPTHQGRGLGKEIVSRLVDASKGHRKIILYAAPGKEPFYRKLGFLRMATAMAIFQNEERMIETGVVVREDDAALRRTA